jgi:hypothetical protein
MDQLPYAGPLYKVSVFMKLTVFEFDLLHSKEYTEPMETKILYIWQILL